MSSSSLSPDAYFYSERELISKWTRCLQDEIFKGKSYCRSYDLSKEGFPYQLFFVCFFFSFIGLLFIRRLLAKPIAKFLLAWAGRRALPGAAVNNHRQKLKRQSKFVGSFVELTFYSTGFIIGFGFLRNQEWVWPSSEWWDETPVRTIPAHMLLYALFYAARYCATFVSLILIEERKKDFYEMVIHHLATVILVCTAITYGYVRISMIVMVLFDAADPFLHLAKLFNYVKQASGADNNSPTFSLQWFLNQITDGLLALFAIVFIVTRIVIYSYVVYSVSYESYLYTNCINHECSFEEGFYENVSFGHHVCVGLIWIINFLQWFWFYLLIKTIYRSIYLGITDDNRSGTDSDQVARNKNTVRGPQVESDDEFKGSKKND